jgi:hypothetical protein
MPMTDKRVGKLKVSNIHIYSRAVSQLNRLFGGRAFRPLMGFALTSFFLFSFKKNKSFFMDLLISLFFFFALG